jgi:hypothetical protein
LLDEAALRWVFLRVHRFPTHPVVSLLRRSVGAYVVEGSWEVCPRYRSYWQGLPCRQFKGDDPGSLG